MVDLKAKPYCLPDEDVRWVEETIAGMTLEEKVGQLFFQLTASQDENYLRELMEKYHLGGCRYNPMPGAAVQQQNRTLQKYAKVPVFIACNTEAGGDGACADGTNIGSGIKIGATRNNDYAYALGKMANEEAAAIGCNMAFAPVCDIHYNWENTEIVTRAFGNDPVRVAQMSKAYMDGLHTIPGFACTAKHFPGNGLDFRDAHLSNNVNTFSVEEWDKTYGMVYKTLIDGGLDAIMGGHIMLPEYARAINPALKDEDMMPATLSPEIMTTLLRGKLGFNGMVVTDASHMVGMTDRMTRREMLPASINAGCDMFLFFNDMDEDFASMMNGYKNGVITDERLDDALHRILALKAHMGLHKKVRTELVPPAAEMERVIGCAAHRAMQKEISEHALTLVKYKDADVLPMTPEKYRRIMIVYVTGLEAKGLGGAMKKLMGGGKNAAESLKEKLEAKGFEVTLYESPMDKIQKRIAAGEKVDFNIYFAGKDTIADFVGAQDLIITLVDVAGGFQAVARPGFGMTKGGGEIPWYVFELPVIVIGCQQPTILADIPQARTYINTYDSAPATLDVLVDELMAGPEAFKGKDPIDSFCGMWDTHL